MGRAGRVWVFSIATAVIAGGCAGPTAPTASETGPAVPPAEPKRLTMAVVFDPIAVFPDIDQRQASASAELNELVNAGLTRVDHNEARYPQLAEAVPTAENGQWKVSPDGTMETTWRIQNGATWHDGTPLSAEDFVFTVNVYRDRELPLFSNTPYGLIDEARAPDPQTLVVRWNRTYIGANELAISPMPKHLVEAAYMENKGGLLELPVWSTEAVGSGPFRVQQFARGSHALLAAFDGYVLGRPKINAIEVKFIQDPNTLAANLLAGAVEATIGRGLSVAQAVAIQQTWSDGRIAEHVFKSWVRIHPQFVDPNPAVILEVPFRQALLHATDRQQIVDTIQERVGAVADVGINNRSPQFSALEVSVVKYPFDSRKAVQLIESLGYRRGADGVFVDGAGQRLSVELRTSADNTARVRALSAIADDWRQAGVAVQETVMPNQLQGDREYRATRCCFEVNRSGTSIDHIVAYHGDGVRTATNRFRGSGRTHNYPRYSHPDLDALIERYEQTIPIPERMRVVGQILEHMTSRVVQMGVYYDVQPVMVHKRISENFIGFTWNAHEWDVAR